MDKQIIAIYLHVLDSQNLANLNIQYSNYTVVDVNINGGLIFFVIPA